ncbi:MAG TPA: CPBP family intramembrane metalloprotease [Candidatus Omnitrophota bacterium]|nr:CPBP family intramembrane metalloprotease [Candidatus Omnitrophota bacterium]HPT07486.1 CPBP family intramembrane metalloprotease [Candidatus Omnitrophota bacterium]
MKKISLREWCIGLGIALLCFAAWFRFGYPQFSSVNLAVDRQKAYAIAQSFLRQRHVPLQEYHSAVVFESDDWTDRYLQKTVGFEGEEKFLQKHQYDLFYWRIRFFREFKKEEYTVEVSSHTGAVLGYVHLIDDIAQRQDVSKEAARFHAEQFIEHGYGIKLDAYDFHEEKIKRYEKRIDYEFSWEKKGVYIPWKKDQGGAKLLLGVKVSGDEIRQFYTQNLDVPEQFERDIAKQLVFGEYLVNIYFIVFILLVIISIYIVVKKKNQVITRSCKKWYLWCAVFLLAMNLGSFGNNFQAILAGYATSVSLGSFIGIIFMRSSINLLVMSVMFIMPGLAGEALNKEVFYDRPFTSLSHYIRSSFLNRSLTRAVIFGYLVFLVMLGVQAVLFWVGQTYLGVWKEWIKLTQFSSAYIPFFGAFALAVNASFNEEVIFRIFGMSLATKYCKRLACAVVCTAVVWGFGHSAYAIFPVWFRGIEVSIIGIIFGIIFLRYGVMPLLVAHYLFDVYWSIAAYVLGKSTPFLLYGSITVFALPLVLGLIAYWRNKSEEERPLTLAFDRTQHYNVGVLVAFVRQKKLAGTAPSQVRLELIEHNWDVELVDSAIKEVFEK